MSLLSYLVPRTVLRFSTQYNSDVRVLEEQGAYKLLVRGSRQSGEYIKILWQTAFSNFGVFPSPDVKNILVLGVAGGTVIHMLHAIYPDAQIEGVDIDEKMIEVGKKYFGLNHVANLTLKRADAKQFVHQAAEEKTEMGHGHRGFIYRRNNSAVCWRGRISYGCEKDPFTQRRGLYQLSSGVRI